MQNTNCFLPSQILALKKDLVVLCYIMNFQLFLLLSENNIVQNFSYAL